MYAFLYRTRAYRGLHTHPKMVNAYERVDVYWITVAHIVSVHRYIDNILDNHTGKIGMMNYDAARTLIYFVSIILVKICNNSCPKLNCNFVELAAHVASITVSQQTGCCIIFVSAHTQQQEKLLASVQISKQGRPKTQINQKEGEEGSSKARCMRGKYSHNNRR